MNIKRHLLLISLLAAVAGCARREEEPSTDTAAAEAASAPEAGPAKVVAAVRAKVSLSPAAQAQFEAQGDRLVVEAIYAGDPTPESQDQVNALGLIELGKTSQSLSGPGTVEFDKSSIDTARLPLIVGQPQIILTVRSDKGLVVCPMFWDSVKSAHEKVAEILCTLPAEAAR